MCVCVCVCVLYTPHNILIPPFFLMISKLKIISCLMFGFQMVKVYCVVYIIHTHTHTHTYIYIYNIIYIIYMCVCVCIIYTTQYTFTTFFLMISKLKIISCLMFGFQVVKVYCVVHITHTHTHI